MTSSAGGSGDPADTEPELRVLLLAQTPPPHHGQAIMLERLANATLSRVRIFHVRMAFSTTTQSVGRFEVRKLAHIVSVIARAAYARFRHRTSMLVFPPASPNRNPVMRDVVLLWALRPLFRRVVFTFHAAGVSEFLESCPRGLRAIAKSAYAKPDGAIVLSPSLSTDAQRFQARRIAVIPNGIPDVAGDDRITRAADEFARVLFVGVLTESKGVLVLLEAARRLAESGTRFEIVFVGDFASKEFEASARALCQAHGLSELVRFAGPLHGTSRWDQFRAADILCLPSHYESEALPLVIIEAMMYRLPVVATRWRGIPDLVTDGVTGTLVPPHDAEDLGKALRQLIIDPALRHEMGERARHRFVQEFTLDRHLRRTEEFLLSVSADDDRATLAQDGGHK